MGSALFLSPLLLLLEFPNNFSFNSFLMSEKFLVSVVASVLDNPLPTRVPFTPFLTDFCRSEFFPRSNDKFLSSARACSTLLKSPVNLVSDTA